MKTVKWQVAVKEVPQCKVYCRLSAHRMAAESHDDWLGVCQTCCLNDDMMKAVAPLLLQCISAHVRSPVVPLQGHAHLTAESYAK